MSMSFKNCLDDLSPNRAAELILYAREKENVLSLAQGEGSFVTPKHIIEAATQQALDGKTFYAPVLGEPALRSALTTYYKNIYNLDIAENRLFVMASGTMAMHIALASIIEPNDEVVALTPIWKNLLNLVEVAKGKIKEVPLEFNGEAWDANLEKFFDAVTEKTKALLIVSPSNPTGWTASHEDIKAITEFARARGLWIISDEVYSRVSYKDTRTPSFLDYSKDDDKLYVVNSFSKSWAMTGWRLGWLVGPQKAENIVRCLTLYNNMGAPSFLQFGGVEALAKGEEFLSDQLDIWGKNRQKVTDFFKSKSTVETCLPEAGFYSFFRVEGECDSFKFARRLIDEAGLSLAPGCSFGNCCGEWMRLCFAVSTEKIDEALDRLDKVLK